MSTVLYFGRFWSFFPLALSPTVLNDFWPIGTLHNGPHDVVTIPTPEPSTVIVPCTSSLAILGLGWLRDRERRAA